MSLKYSNPSKLKRALQKKGFKDVGRGKKHHVFALFVNGKQTTIYTEVSRGTSKIKTWVFSKMYKQLKMPTKKYLSDLLDCPIEKEEYIQHLLDKEDLYSG